MGARTRTGWHPCRLLPLLPGDGESLSSLLDRQAQCWGTTRRQMMLQVSPLQCMSAGDVDLMEAEGFLGDYAAACGLPVEALAAHRAERKDHLLPQHLRIAYCPICFAERLEQGEAPYFRLDWARRLLTHCLIHRCPLFPWGSSNSEGRRRMPANWLDGNPARPVYVRNFREHLAKARDFAPGALPKWRGNRATWKALIEFEAFLYREGVGNLHASPNTFQAGLLERNVLRIAAMLVRPPEGKVPDALVNQLNPRYSDRHVLRFTPTDYTIGKKDPTWSVLSGPCRSLPSRRSVILLVACVLGHANDEAVRILGDVSNWRDNIRRAMHL